MPVGNFFPVSGQVITKTPINAALPSGSSRTQMYAETRALMCPIGEVFLVYAGFGKVLVLVAVPLTYRSRRIPPFPQDRVVAPLT
jgi:hypothetical protein